MNCILRRSVAATALLTKNIPAASILGSYSCNSLLAHPMARSFAAAPKKKGKKEQAAPAPEQKKSESLIPINIFVDGKDPEVLPDDQYPDWLWHMLDPKVTPDEWKTANYKGISEEEMTGIVRIRAARRIKAYNLSKAK